MEVLPKIIFLNNPIILYIFSEVLRVIDSLHLTAQKKVATPVDWQVTTSIYFTFLF